MKLLLDTNVILDALQEREPHQKNAKLILALGEMRVFDLWISASQATDIFYLLSEGGKSSRLQAAKNQLKNIRESVSACAFTAEDVDNALASTWADFEDACINQVAHKIKPDAIITGNTADFQLSDYPVFDCNAFFDWLEAKYNVVYDVVDLGSSELLSSSG